MSMSSLSDSSDAWNNVSDSQRDLLQIARIIKHLILRNQRGLDRNRIQLESIERIRAGDSKTFHTWGSTLKTMENRKMPQQGTGNRRAQAGASTNNARCESTPTQRSAAGCCLKQKKNKPKENIHTFCSVLSAVADPPTPKIGCCGKKKATPEIEIVRQDDLGSSSSGESICSDADCNCKAAPQEFIKIISLSQSTQAVQQLAQIRPGKVEIMRSAITQSHDFLSIEKRKSKTAIKGEKIPDDSCQCDPKSEQNPICGEPNQPQLCTKAKTHSNPQPLCHDSEVRYKNQFQDRKSKPCQNFIQVKPEQKEFCKCSQPDPASPLSSKSSHSRIMQLQRFKDNLRKPPIADEVAVFDSTVHGKHFYSTEARPRRPPQIENPCDCKPGNYYSGSSYNDCLCPRPPEFDPSGHRLYPIKAMNDQSLKQSCRASQPQRRHAVYCHGPDKAKPPYAPEPRSKFACTAERAPRPTQYRHAQERPTARCTGLGTEKQTCCAEAHRNCATSHSEKRCPSLAQKETNNPCGHRTQYAHKACRTDRTKSDTEVCYCSRRGCRLAARRKTEKPPACCSHEYRPYPIARANSSTCTFLKDTGPCVMQREPPVRTPYAQPFNPYCFGPSKENHQPDCHLPHRHKTRYAAPCFASQKPQLPVCQYPKPSRKPCLCGKRANEQVKEYPPKTSGKKCTCGEKYNKPESLPGKCKGRWEGATVPSYPNAPQLYGYGNEILSPIQPRRSITEPAHPADRYAAEKIKHGYHRNV